MYSKTYAPHTAHLEREPITKQQAIDAAAHWRRIANQQDAIADSETAHGRNASSPSTITCTSR